MATDYEDVRALVDDKTVRVLEDWAKLEGRSKQMHCGILLRRLAGLYQNSPDKIEQIGILTPNLRNAAA